MYLAQAAGYAHNDSPLLGRPTTILGEFRRLESLEQAKAVASYSVYLPDNEPEVNIPIPEGVEGRVIRVQLEGTGYLSIAELQAYELTFLPLSK